MSESHVENQVKARIAAARRRSEDMRRQRAELAAARRAGLAKRHAAKLRQQAAGTGQPPTSAGQNTRVAKGTQIASTPDQADDRTSSPVTCGDTPTADGLRGSESNADVTDTDTTAEDQA